MKGIISALKMAPRAIYGALAAGVVTTTAVVAINVFTSPSSNSDIFFDDFNGDSLDQSKWLIAEKAWGGNNGGVIPENVSVSNGTLKLEAHGNQYSGEIPGINQPTGVRTGASIATREYFASGSYEVVAKVAPEPGAVSAIWTFEYEEYYPGDKEYEELGATGSYTTVNHEIDIEIPGHIKKNEIPDFKHVNFNTFVTETKDTSRIIELPSPQNDGNWHTYRFDWHTGDKNEKARVEYYVDNVLYETITTTIPTKAGRFWVGVWFPATVDSDGDGKGDSGWAGVPNFDTAIFEIDSVKITPYHEAGDEKEKETYGKDGWAVDSFPEDIEKENYNHIQNGDFKKESEFWNLSGDAKVVEEQGILSTGSKTDTISQNVEVLPKLTYTLSADVVTDGTEVTIGVKKLNGSSDMSKKIKESGHVCVTFETDSSMKELKVYAEVLRYQNTKNEVKVDNFVLTSGKECDSKLDSENPKEESKEEDKKEDKKEDLGEKEESKKEELPDKKLDDKNSLIINGDFSKGKENWNFSGGTTFDGKKAILASGNDTDTISQTIKVKKSKTYLLTADVITEGAEITVGVKDYNGRYTDISKKVNKSGSISIKFKTAGHIDMITVYAEVLRYQKNKENVYLDNVKLVEVKDTSSNKITETVIPKNTLIQNGTFDSTKNWNLIGSARIENGKAILASGKDTDIVEQTVAVKAKTKYRLKADIVTEGATVDLYVSGYNGKYTEKEVNYNNSINGVLEFITGDVKEIKVHVRVMRYQDNGADVFVDNVILEEI